MREPDVDRERDAAPAAPAQLTVMSSGSAARPGPEGPSGIVRVEPETRSERVESRSWASELPAARARNPDFLGPESRKSGSGFRERNPGPPARADRKPRLRGGAPSRKPGAKARPRRSGFRHRTPAPVTLAPPVTSTAGPSYCIAASHGAWPDRAGVGAGSSVPNSNWKTVFRSFAPRCGAESMALRRHGAPGTY